MSGYAVDTDKLVDAAEPILLMGDLNHISSLEMHKQSERIYDLMLRIEAIKRKRGDK